MGGRKMTFLLQLTIIIVATKLAGDLAVRLGQPAVLGKLLVGVCLGPALLGWIEKSQVLDVFSTIGVLLLMFFAGLESDIRELNANRNASFAVALGGMLLPFGGGYLLGIWTGMSVNEALFLGLLLAATSVSISVQTFKELGIVNTRESMIVLGAALVDDVLVVILLAFLMSVLTVGDVNLTLLVAQKFLFFAAIIVIGWKIVPLLMNKLSRLRINEPVISLAVAICFGFSLFAESLGVAGMIGAFAAGVAISRTPFKQQVEHKLEPIAYAIFVPVFFAGIGLSFSLTGFTENLWFTLGLTVVAIVTKLLGAGLGARLTGSSTRSSLIIGAGMVSRGEVALIIAATGLSAGLLQQTFYSSTIIAIIVSTLATPPILKWLTARKG
jgi:Kef-type K+ transport system membrane component KefB